MCTLTWEFSPKHYTVFFNRDERKSRPLAAPIRIVQSSDGLRQIHPVDGAKGGSWIVVNAWGVTTCLLNLYEVMPPPEPPGGFDSRGWLVLSVGHSCGWQESQDRFAGIDLQRFPPFHLFQFDPQMGVKSAKWNGVSLEWGDHPYRCEVPVSGSSFRNAEVVAARREQFAERVRADDSALRLNQLEQYHRSSLPGLGAYSVNMLRADAQTLSLSRVDVDCGRLHFAYWARSIDALEMEAPVTLSLQRESELL